jgi:hypothetical protein
MVGFVKFDPWAFLESEQRAAANGGLARTPKDDTHPANKPRTLAALATLAAQPSQNEGWEVGQSSSPTDHNHRGENRKCEAASAKVAKVAKVEKPIATSEEAPCGDVEEERAAIAEYDGGAPRAWAEALARLDPAYPPGDVLLKRWVQFIDDCGRFLDEGWAVCAARLGWEPIDLFGCNRIKPFARINRAGLLWLLNGRKLLALSADAAAIATASGSYHTFRRHMREPGGVPAWELSPKAEVQ